MFHGAGCQRDDCQRVHLNRPPDWYELRTGLNAFETLSDSMRRLILLQWNESLSTAKWHDAIRKRNDRIRHGAGG